jgi:hypothetical protein
MSLGSDFSWLVASKEIWDRVFNVWELKKDPGHKAEGERERTRLKLSTTDTKTSLRMDRDEGHDPFRCDVSEPP